MICLEGRKASHSRPAESLLVHLALCPQRGYCQRVSYTSSAAPDRASVSCATDELNGSTQEATWRASQSLSHTNGHIRKNRHIAPDPNCKSCNELRAMHEG